MGNDIKDLCDKTRDLSFVKNPIPTDKSSKSIHDLCLSFVGHHLDLRAKFSFDMKSTIISNCNAVGDIFEEVFYERFKETILGLEKGPKQASPDYWTSNKEFEYELKTFTKTPGFDIANYLSFLDQLSKDGGVERKLFRTKYLVFEYEIKSDEKIYIKDFYYLHVWNIVGYSTKYPITIQNKKGIWYNIRPSTVKDWKNENKTPKMFIEAIIDSINITPNPIENKSLIIDNILKQFKGLEAKYLF